ncbi:hypothetical protein COO60DRAFT_1463811 [Scenedesmus sp. NREL 46B-D3]|nr:hypothetical protein COO60DRAFT_1463811 [Scenedesmus sp. NREL 46B-D3]
MWLIQIKIAGVGKTTSKRLVNAKSGAYHQRKRGAAEPEKKEKSRVAAVGPVMLGFFLFVVVAVVGCRRAGDALFTSRSHSQQMIQKAVHEAYRPVVAQRSMQACFLGCATAAAAAG